MSLELDCMNCYDNTDTQDDLFIIIQKELKTTDQNKNKHYTMHYYEIAFMDLQTIYCKCVFACIVNQQAEIN